MITSPSSTNARSERRPFSSAGSRSPASLSALSRLSTTMGLLTRRTSSPTSRRISELDPAALMCVPGDSHFASNSGVAAVVTVLTMSLPRTVSSGDPAATTSIFRRCDIFSQNAPRRSALRENTLTRRSGRTAAMASRCPSDCHPEPNRPRISASGRASQRVATPDAAPVRIMPSKSASRTTRSMPVEALNTWTRKRTPERLLV